MDVVTGNDEVADASRHVDLASRVASSGDLVFRKDELRQRTGELTCYACDGSRSIVALEEVLGHGHFLVRGDQSDGDGDAVRIVQESSLLNDEFEHVAGPG